MYLLKSMPAASRVNIHPRVPLCLSSSGVIYAANATILVKSSDWGTTWANVNDFGVGATIRKAHKLDNGRIIVTLASGKVLVSDVNEANFVEKIDFVSESASWGGLRVFGDIVVMCNYGSPQVVYLSVDGAQNFSLILNASSIKLPDGMNHFHDVCYDPYESLIWICAGDNLTSQKIGWTDDFGKTWYWTGPSINIRITQIIPLPKRVLFGTDEYDVLGVYVHERPDTGTHGNGVKPKLGWVARNFYATVVGQVDMGWITRAAISFHEIAAAYFGVYLTNNIHSCPACSIYGTKDGKNFFSVWTEAKAQVTPATVSRVTIGVLGPDNSNNIVATLHDPVTAQWNIVRLTNPLWVWVED